MANTIGLDKELARRVINEIIDDVTSVAQSSTNFREAFEEEAKRSNLVYINELSKDLAVVEELSRKLKTTFIEVREMIESYIKQMEAYDSL